MNNRGGRYKKRIIEELTVTLILGLQFVESKLFRAIDNSVYKSC